MAPTPTHLPHPWHGLPLGDDAPNIVHAFIEMTPGDNVKYEVDKESGYIIVDRPRRYSSQLPMIYGFVPRTYCAERVAALSDQAEVGDHDPIDICVFSERPIQRANILLKARIVGGLHMVDGGEADDKLVAVLDGDLAWGDVTTLDQLPACAVERLRHYFLTYKEVPGEGEAEVTIDDVYGVQRAQEVLEASMADYETHYG